MLDLIILLGLYFASYGAVAFFRFWGSAASPLGLVLGAQGLGIILIRFLMNRLRGVQAQGEDVALGMGGLWQMLMLMLLFGALLVWLMSVVRVRRGERPGALRVLLW